MSVSQPKPKVSFRGHRDLTPFANKMTLHYLIKSNDFSQNLLRVCAAVEVKGDLIKLPYPDLFLGFAKKKDCFFFLYDRTHFYYSATAYGASNIYDTSNLTNDTGMC